MQWLDPPSAAALGFVLRRAGEDHRVRFLLSRRADADGRVTLGSEGLRDGSVDLREIGPLSLGALHRVVTSQLGHSLSRPVLARVHAVSGGNPFFALELARVAEQRGSAGSTQDLPLPASLAETLHERLNALPTSTRDSLAVVAAVSTPTLDVLERAIGVDARSVLQPAVDSGMLVPDETSLRFSHPLIAATVYAEVWPSRRRECHRLLATIVDEPDERARHLALSSDGPDSELAVALEEAAQRARRRGAPEAAASLIEQSLKATPLDDADNTWRRGLLTSEYQLQSGDLGRFRSSTEGLLRTARSGDERSMAYALLSIAPAGTETGRSLLERALAEAESTHQRQSVESDLVTEVSLGGDLAEGAVHGREALRLAEALDDPATLADAICAVARLEQLLGLGLRRDLLERADALHQLRETDRLEATVGLVRTTVTSASLLVTADEFGEARRRGEALQRVLELQGLVQSLPEVLRFRAELECWAGDWDLAETLADAGEELAEQTGRLETLDDLMYTRAYVAAHRGRESDARRLASEGVSAAEARGNQRNLLRNLGVLGFLELSLGNSGAAAELLERAMGVAQAAGFVEPNWLRFHGDLIEALVDLGRVNEAAPLVTELEHRAGVTSYPWTAATAARCRGLLLATANELDQAVHAFLAAIAFGEQVANPFELARTQLELGRTFRRRRQRVQAREALNAALERFEELGAIRWVEKTRDELGRVSGRRAAEPEELTEAERRIASLVAGGSSNKEVAAALVVTVHTVEGALTRVYRKLGVRSRTELAARFAGEPEES